MRESIEHMFPTILMMVCGTVLLAFGDPFGRELIILAVGSIIGGAAK